MKKQLELSQIEEEFKSFANLQMLNEFSFTPEKALDLLIEFYNSIRVIDVEDNIGDNDMLLFEYGIYDWNDGNGTNFSLDFTRQFIFKMEDEPYQLRLTLYYPSAEAVGIDNYNRWSIADQSINEWASEVKSTVGFKIASSITPKSFDIRFSQQ